jgi:hypothetical protein
MGTNGEIKLANLRIWRDEELDRVWRLSYSEGESDTLISFPDDAALHDFINEQLGLGLDEDVITLPLQCSIYAPEHTLDPDDVRHS